MKPELFIGSSVEGLKYAEAIETKLNHDFNIILWTDGVFNLSSTTIDDLITRLHKSDFGIFVFSEDDITIIRNKEYTTARDNVLYELGLYTGKLGRYNTFIIKPSAAMDFHLPTDLSGIYIGQYDSNKLDNIESAVSAFTSSIKRQVKNNSKYIFNGKWDFMWQVENSKNYPEPLIEEVDVFHYEEKLKFIHTISETEKYLICAIFRSPYLTGEWKPLNGVGYDGTFQMKLNGRCDKFEGVWIGWGEKGKINSGICSLSKK